MSQKDPYFLSKGSHATAADGRCAMEWVAYLAGEPHSDQPVCVSPVLRSFCIALNDRLPDAERQKLRPYLARTIGTAGDGRDGERVQILRDWLIRTRLPNALDLAGRHELAEQLRQLPGELTAQAVNAACRRARDEAWSARRDARDRLYQEFRKCWSAYAAYAAAAYAAAAAAAADAYADAADAAYAAAAAAAADAAYAAAAYAAADAAAYAADAVPPLAEIRQRAREAAEEKLRPLIEQSRRDAFELLERMLPTEVIQLPVVADAEAITNPQEIIA